MVSGCCCSFGVGLRFLCFCFFWWCRWFWSGGLGSFVVFGGFGGCVIFGGLDDLVVLITLADDSDGDMTTKKEVEVTCGKRV